MEELTIIIPIHKYDSNTSNYLNRAVISVQGQTSQPKTIVVIGPKSAITPVQKEFSSEVEYITNTGELDYCSQINTAVKQVKTKFFSILEFDDAYTKNWVKNVEQYIKSKPDVSIFLPISKFVNKEGEEIGLVNEIIWAQSFSNELGVIDVEILQDYTDFVTTGGVFNTSDFIEVGGLKPSIKLSFWYEFLLRSVEQGTKVFVIPKTGYIHMVNREDSYQDQLKDMTPKERMFWIKLARKEYFFKKERIEKAKYVVEKTIEDVL